MHCVLQCPASKVTNEELSMAKASAGMMSAAGGPKHPVTERALRAVHPNILGEVVSFACVECEKNQQNGWKWLEIAGNGWKLLESLTFNGQKWTKTYGEWLLILHQWSI